MPILKNLKSIVDRVNSKSGTSEGLGKPYLLLLVPNNANPDPETGEFNEGEFIAIRGRKNTFDYIMENVIIYGYRPLESFILSGGITFGNEVSMYTFVRHCIEKFKYEDISALESLHNDMFEIDSNLTKEYLDIFYTNELTRKAS